MPKIQSPSGTRDMYPADLLKRRYIEKLWRDTSIRHGFEEIDGPTFEHADLYAVKSGEGILSEVFQVHSGKDEAEVAKIRAGANAPYALRPEFTPTLARMYAAKAGSLPKPTKWFWQQNCFRAEKQQRGRLREFGQWNCDVLGDGSLETTADLIGACIGLLEICGLESAWVRVKINHREVVRSKLIEAGVAEGKLTEAMSLLDRRSKINPAMFALAARELQFDYKLFDQRVDELNFMFGRNQVEYKEKRSIALLGAYDPLLFQLQALEDIGVEPWLDFDVNVIRGLAYYTGTVFEVLADGERAIAGGGRYDNLIELFGGPPTPAVGFGMGDVVLSLVLQDRGLMPEGDALMDALSRPSASYRPDAFVISAGQTPEDQDAAAKQVRPLVARLRRGVESGAYKDNTAHKPWDANRFDASSGGGPPFHARSSSKSTKNIGKLLQDAVAQKAKLAIILENAEEATIKDLRTNHQDTERTKIADLGRVIAQRLA